MLKKISFYFLLAIGVVYCVSFGRSTPADQTAAIVKSANTFLSSLDATQKSKVLFPLIRQPAATAAKFARTGGPGGPGGPGKGGNADEKKAMDHPPQNSARTRNDANNTTIPKNGPGGGGPGQFPGFVGEQYGSAVWSNYPVSDVPRPGVRLGTLTASQREAAMDLLRVLLSEKGYEKVQEIMGADQMLADAGENFVAGKDAYTLAIFGAPNTDTPWMVEFGGHHLALNIVIAGAQGALTPTLTGAQPAVYTVGGKTIRVLAAENDKAFDLLASLDDQQKKKAILNYSIGDLVLGPGHDGESIVPEGLKASEMNEQQKELLTNLIFQWVGIISTPYVDARMQEIKAGINETYFAWSGPSTHAPGRNGSSYYRIQGPRVIIEFSPQGVGGDLTMHVHTIYRDPLNNYGNAFFKAH